MADQGALDFRERQDALNAFVLRIQKMRAPAKDILDDGSPFGAMKEIRFRASENKIIPASVIAGFKFAEVQGAVATR